MDLDSEGGADARAVDEAQDKERDSAYRAFLACELEFFLCAYVFSLCYDDVLGAKGKDGKQKYEMDLTA